MWPKKRVKELKKLWASGLTGSQVAEALGEGLTREAVLGKVHRLKLKPRHPRKNGDKSVWTPEYTELLKKLWTTNLSAAKIAKVIGDGDVVTRNAVIGKAHRLGLPKRREGSFRTKVCPRDRKKAR